MLGDAEQIDAGAVAPEDPRGVLPSTATALNRPRGSVLVCSAPRRARYLRTLAEAGTRGRRRPPEQDPAQRPRVHVVQHDPDRLVISPSTGLPSDPTGRAADPGVLAWINSDSRMLDSESVVRLPGRMAAIIMEAADGSYERGRRRFAAGGHPRPDEDIRSR